MDARAIFTLLFAFVVPALAVFGARRVRLLGVLGPVVLCYGAGIVTANFAMGAIDAALATSISEAAVGLAIPMLLFSCDVRRWFGLARSTLVSFALACVAVLIVSGIAARMFAGSIPDAWKIAGMLVGVYVGGTPNMSAIGIALGVSDETFVLVNGADVIASSVYLLFLVSVAQRLLLRVMPAFRSPEGEPVADPMLRGTEDVRAKDRAISILLAALVAGGSIGLSLLVLGKIETVLVMLAVTSGGIGLSMLPGVRAIAGSYQTGEFVLLAFCASIGLIADLRRIVDVGGVYLLYVAVVLFASAALHFALAAIARIDADTAIITSTAAIFGPAFVGPVAASLKNRDIVVSGLTTGLMGYALGNYLGLGLAWLVR
ncbi:MAG: DUF819 family protein [Deltaproteobacteria bacterium]|nr:DUF819 family protein [Deltaproteobacteria bacterium]